MLRTWTELSAAVGAGFLSLLVSLPAAAQGVSTPPTVIRRGQDIRDQPSWINHADCIADAEYEFTLAAVGSIPSSADLHIWAAKGGADCTASTARDESDCKQVFQDDVFRSGSQNITATVKVREIVRPGAGTLPDAATPETVCNENPPDKTDVILQFFVLDSGGITLPSAATYAVSYDLLGPEPPTSVRAGVGENALVVRWKAASDDSLGRYDVYVNEAGGEPDAGGAAGASSGSCTSDVLVPNEVPTIDARAESNGNTTEAEAGRLQNGVLYAVGVSSIDNFENPGVLSNLACATPEPVTGFFEAYRDAGGRGGGGYCSIGATSSRLSAAMVALVAVGFAVRRRRTRVARRAS